MSDFKIKNWIETKRVSAGGCFAVIAETNKQSMGVKSACLHFIGA